MQTYYFTMLMIILFKKITLLLVYPRKRSCGGIYWNQPVGRAVGRAFGLSAKSCPDNSSYSFSPICLILGRSCSLGAVDVQDTHFVKIPSSITELLPLI